MVGAWLHHGRFQKYPLYMLCASAYTTADAAIFHNYIGRTYKWGYFPKAKEYDVVELMRKKLSVTSAGWKHPQASIELAASLKEKGYSFRMSIIGNGEMEAQLHEMIRRKGVDDSHFNAKVACFSDSGLAMRMIYVGIVLQLFGAGTVLTRIAQYFQVFILILIPNNMMRLDQKSRMMVRMILYSLAIVYFIKLTLIPDPLDIVPYKLFWEV